MQAARQYASLNDLLNYQAQVRSTDLALNSVNRASLTYQQLLEFSNRIRTTLRASGIGHNDRVAIVLPNGIEMAALFLGITSNAVSAPLNPSYTADEFRFYLTDLRAKALVTLTNTTSPALEVARSLGLTLLTIAPDKLENGLTLVEETSHQAIKPDEGIPQGQDTALLLHTSGTTSRPKLVPLAHQNILASAQNIAQTLKLTPQDVCLNVMPLFHIHGLIGALLSSVHAGAQIICTPGFNAPTFFEWIETFAPSWYTAVPTIHQSILRRAEDNREIIDRRPLRFIRSSSAALPPSVITGLETTFSAPVIEAYGMTEASHQMASNPLPPAVRKIGSVGQATGIDVAIMDDHGGILAAHQTGEIVIQGASVISGYEANEEANANSFVRGWFRTGDEGYLDEDGYLYIRGRLKEIINRGGEKISPREVDEIILQHPAVSQAVTFAILDQMLGEDVAAAVVLKESASISERGLRDFVAESLAEFKVPRHIVFLSEIPKGATGKIQRIGLAKKLGISGDPSPNNESIAYVAPRNPIEEMVAEVWSAVLRQEHIGVNHTFVGLGGDSLLATQIVSRLRDGADIEVTLRDFFDTPTIASMSALIERKLLDEMDSPAH